MSLRRLFFTHHQVYFECNSVLCCDSESLDNSNRHSMSIRQTTAGQSGHPQRTFPPHCYGCGGTSQQWRIRKIPQAEPRAPVHDEKYVLNTDSLDGFPAILTRLAENYSKDGFVQGLPVKDFPRALLWSHPTPPRRRVDFLA